MNNNQWIEEHNKNSKYYRKHYDASNYHPWEFQCQYCKGKFEADLSQFAYEYRDDGDFAQIYCPYCGGKFEVAM